MAPPQEGLPDWFIEAEFRTDRACPTASPHSIIEHPFQVLIYDESFDVMVLATVALGVVGTPLLHVHQLINTVRRWAMAVVINRSSLTLNTVVRPIEDSHATPLTT